MKPFLVLFVCVGLVQGLVEWPFKNRNSQYDGTFVEASVGSPGKIFLKKVKHLKCTAKRCSLEVKNVCF